jgi:hypothetical protein
VRTGRRNGTEKSHLKLLLINMFRVQVAIVEVIFHKSKRMRLGSGE